jgi:hypothetical protein
MIFSASEFVRLRTSDDPEEYRRAASDEASEDVWIEIIENYSDMKIWVAGNKTVPLSVLSRLSDDPDPEVRFAVASKRKLDQSLIEKMACDKDESVRQRIAYNQKTPLEILELLAADSEEMVSSVAKKRLQAD